MNARVRVSLTLFFLTCSTIPASALEKAPALPDFGRADFTVMAWMRTTQGGTIFSMSSAEGVWAERGGKVFFVRGGKLGFDACYVGVISGKAKVTDGQWHHAAIAFQARTDRLTFYVDGKLDAARKIKPDPDAAGHIVRVGMAAKNFHAPNGFTGDLDEVRVYARALTAAELAASAQIPSRAPEDCALHWAFEDGAKNAAGDRLHGAIDGAIDGAAPAPGKIGQALRFDGKGVAALPPDPNFIRRQRARREIEKIEHIDVEALRLAIADLSQTFGDRYPNGSKYLRRLAELRREASAGSALAGDERALASARQLLALQREALLANPLLDFDELLLLKRGEGNLGLPTNWQSNSSMATRGYDNELAVLPMQAVLAGKADVALKTFFRPPNGEFVGDVDLHFDGGRMLFSMPAKRWQIFELDGAGANLRQLALIEEPDVDNYDACYLPDGNIIFSSTAPFVGVPCVKGASHVSNLYLYDSAKKSIRRLTFEQDHDWCPTVLNNGRVMYLRWEYSDIPHFVSRILFHMNPDGTSQQEHYGSNSYWPNAMFYARPIPGHPTKFAAVVGGHHDLPRMGDLVLFDPALGRHEADGALQRIPGRGKAVEPVILDGLTQNNWPKFLHPFPLSEKYLITACKPSAQTPWGIYLVDVFDNMLLLHEERGYAMLEPLPLRATPRPPAIPSKVQPGRKDALIYVADVYAGPGLKGVPRGSVKRLRVITYHFAYHGMGGQINRVGLDGPWDVKRIMGTVPVETDGSVMFRAPANTPIAVQPLDAEGKALQLMRSWMTAMPGETLSCVGCHERQNSAPPSRQTLAAIRPPSDIAPWHGPARGFSFKGEVQPVLDRQCVRCHDGKPRDDGRVIDDYTARAPVHTTAGSAAYNNGTQFTPSYLALRGWVRTPTIESDMHLLPAGEFHADTTHLVQMLKRGHQDVRLEAEDWDRLITWIDLNAPAHGTWAEVVGGKLVDRQNARRREMQKRYDGFEENPEAVFEELKIQNEKLKKAAASTGESAAFAGRPGVVALASAEKNHLTTVALVGDAKSSIVNRQSSMAGPQTLKTVDLGADVVLELTRVPQRETSARPFWIGRCEITNEQFRRFDPAHDSRLEHGDFLQFSIEERGYPLNGPKQPVVRVSYERALAFCRWLSERTGETFTLPTAEQWTHACRAGAETPLWYGAVDADFAPYANLADASFRKVDTFPRWKLPSGAIHEWRPAIASVNDKHRVSAPVGGYQPNPWGLFDMHGNAAEWTLSPAPRAGEMLVLGGSWADRPAWATPNVPRRHKSYLGVYDVGFRVICEATPAPVPAVARAAQE